MEADKLQKNHLLINEKKEMQGWLNASLKSTETRDDLSITCNLNKISFIFLQTNLKF